MDQYPAITWYLLARCGHNQHSTNYSHFYFATSRCLPKIIFIVCSTHFVRTFKPERNFQIRRYCSPGRHYPTNKCQIPIRVFNTRIKVARLTTHSAEVLFNKSTRKLSKDHFKFPRFSHEMYMLPVVGAVRAPRVYVPRWEDGRISTCARTYRRRPTSAVTTAGASLSETNANYTLTKLRVQFVSRPLEWPQTSNVGASST